MKRLLRLGVPFWPLQSTHPSGRLEVDPLHMMMAPIGTVPVPEIVPVTFRSPETVAFPVAATGPAFSVFFTLRESAVMLPVNTAFDAVSLPATVKSPLARETLDANAAYGTGSSFWRGEISPDVLCTVRPM